jgi:hypothetical protein
MIQNCPIAFRKQCPQRWEALSPTDQPAVRHCGECDRQVHLCTTSEDAAVHARAGHCIALAVESMAWGPRSMVVGEPDPPPYGAAPARATAWSPDHWTRSEERLAHQAIEIARQAELQELVAAFKAQAAAARGPDDVWDIVSRLTRRKPDFDVCYDRRASRLFLVLGRLLREGRLSEAHLRGLSEDKLSRIRNVASL